MNKQPDRGVLVLGSAGFIGSAVIRTLLNGQRPVYALGRAELTIDSDRITRVRGSIEDGALLRDLLAECSDIVYAAGLTTPGSSAAEPCLEVTGNLLPLARLLECAPVFADRHLVYVSSGGTIYGNDARDADETRLPKPRSYYGAGKAAAELLIRACTSTNTWRATVLRPTNPYGPGQTAQKGFAIVPTLFQRALDGTAFHVWGDGSIVRDYCYIHDLAAAIVACLSSQAKGGSDDSFRVFNVASGHAVSIVELIAACEYASARKISLEFKPARDIDVTHVSPRSDAIAAAIGWLPTTTLADGLAKTWAWMRRSSSY